MLNSLPKEMLGEFLKNLSVKDILSYCATNKVDCEEVLPLVIRLKYGLNSHLFNMPPKDALKFIHKVLTFDPEEEEEEWDPFDLPDEDRFRINPDIGDIIFEVVDTRYYEFVEFALDSIIANLYWEHDIGNIHWLKEAFELAHSRGDYKIANLLLAYYMPEDTDYDYPELSWGENTRRYNRIEPLPYYEKKIRNIDNYTPHEHRLIQYYIDRYEEFKERIRPDLVEKFEKQRNFR